MNVNRQRIIVKPEHIRLITKICTQQELADLIGTRQPHVSKWATGASGIGKTYSRIIFQHFPYIFEQTEMELTHANDQSV